MSITVRQADHRDVELLVDLSRIAQELHAAAEPEYFKRHEPGAVAKVFRSNLQRPEVQVWIANIDEAAVGYAVVAVHDRPKNAICQARRFCFLEEIAVSPAHRRKGVARALVDRVLTEARSQGVPDVELTCWSFNADAQAAFKSLGFRPMMVRFRRETD